MNLNDLVRLLNIPRETENVEFKEAKRAFNRDRLLEYCVAIANSGGGHLILGVTDKPPRNVVGTDAFRDGQEIRRLVREKTGLRVDLHIHSVDEKRVVVVEIPSRPSGTPLHLDGRFLTRSGDEIVPMDASQVQRLRDESHPDFSADICPGATLDDFSVDALRRLRNLYSSRVAHTQIQERNDWQLLNDLGLATDSGVTNAALILLGTQEAIARWLPQAEVILEYRFNDSDVSHHDRREFHEGFLLFDEELWRVVNDRNLHHSHLDGLIRRDIPALNEFVVREALLNAITHRDYRNQGSIFLRQYPSRLLVENPGGFPEGITSQNILNRQMPRNRLLSDVLLKCGLVERSGQGVDRMFRETISDGKSIPDYSQSDEYHVTVNLDGTIDERFLRFLERIGNELMEAFTTEDLLIVRLIHRDEQVGNSLRQRIPRLRELGIIESVGRGRGVRYFLSRRFYEEAGETGTYTRRRGLDRETNKQVLLRHLGTYTARGCRLNELHEVLPALSIDSVRTLLRELKADGLIHVRGRTRAARWFPGPGESDE